MKTKRILSALLAVIMLFSLVACDGSGTEDSVWDSYIIEDVSSVDAPANNDSSEKTESTGNDEPASSEEPVSSDKPVSSEKPVSSNTPASSEESVSSEKPVSSDKPVSSQAPTSSEKPVSSDKPVSSQAPTSSENTSSKQENDDQELIKKGTKPVSEGINLAGKTITYGIGVELTDDVKLMIKSFEKKYDCTVSTDYLTFDNYVQMLAAKVAAGNHYDIVQIEGLRFPSIAIANMCEPLEDVISTADFNNTDNVSRGGFDQQLSENFIWNNHLYAVVGVRGEYAANMTVLFYNKKLFKDAGADDPRELYEKGKWDWDAFYELGTLISENTDAKMCDTTLMKDVGYWNDAWPVDISNINSPKAALTSSKMITAYEFAQKVFGGANPIGMTSGSTGQDPTTFLEGKLAMFGGFAFHLYTSYKLGESVENSNAFQKNIKNLGIVPVPLGPDNKREAYKVGSWVYGIGAGVGTSDPAIAMTFAQFASVYSGKPSSGYSYSSEDQALLDKMQLGEKIWQTTSYADGSNTAYDLIHKMQGEIFGGGDIAQILSAYNAQVQNCIDVTIKQK